MPWEVKTNTQPVIIETIYTGIVTPAQLTQAIDATIAAAAAAETRLLLADCSMLEGGHTVIDLFSEVERIIDLGIGERIKEAVIFPENGPTAAEVEFWETACLNRGMRVKIFPERAKAVDWLTGN